jgi:hypothetical protein
VPGDPPRRLHRLARESKIERACLGADDCSARKDLESFKLRNQFWPFIRVDVSRACCGASHGSVSRGMKLLSEEVYECTRQSGRKNIRYDKF